MKDMTMSRGLNRGGRWALMVVALGLLMWSAVTVPAYAQTPTPSETENAVINCGDSPSGHGGSADNPPTCIDESGEEVPAVVVVQPAETPVPVPVPAQVSTGSGENLVLQDSHWFNLHDVTSEKVCIEAKETIGLRAVNTVSVDDNLVDDADDGDVEASNKKHCIQFTTRIDAAHVIEITVTRE